MQILFFSGMIKVTNHREISITPSLVKNLKKALVLMNPNRKVKGPQDGACRQVPLNITFDARYSHA